MGYKCPTLATKPTERAVLVGLRIAAARDAAGHTNSSLSRVTGIDRSNLRGLIAGRNEPSVRTLERIASATGKTIDYFQPEQRRTVTISAAVESLVEALTGELRQKIEASIDDLVGAAR